MLVVSPLAAGPFNQEVVAPVAAGAVDGLGGGAVADALLNALVYRRELFGGRVARLPPSSASTRSAGGRCPAAAALLLRGSSKGPLRYARDAPPWANCRANNRTDLGCDWRERCVTRCDA